VAILLDIFLTISFFPVQAIYEIFHFINSFILQKTDWWF